MENEIAFYGHRRAGEVGHTRCERAAAALISASPTIPVPLKICSAIYARESRRRNRPEDIERAGITLVAPV